MSKEPKKNMAKVTINIKITFSDFDALIFWIIKQNFHLFLKD